MQHGVLGNKINVYVAVTHDTTTTSEEGNCGYDEMEKRPA